EHRFSVPAGGNHSLLIPGLRRVAVASAKIARVTAVPPATLLVTGMQPGITTVRAWDDKDRESVFVVEVQSPQLFGGFRDGDGQGVVKIALEFLEVDSTVTENLGLRWPDAIHFSVGAVLHGDAARAGLNYTVPFTSAAGWIQHLTRNGWARLLAKPDLYVRLG